MVKLPDQSLCYHCGHRVMKMRGVTIHLERTFMQILTASFTCKCGCGKPVDAADYDWMDDKHD